MTVVAPPAVPLRAPARVPVIPAGPVIRELAGLDDLQLLGIFRSLPPASERRAAACEVLVNRYLGLVRGCARRFRLSTEPAEDLMQVGYVGLVKAISNFDPAVGGSLAAYAQVTVSGELKRHFRDKCWQVRVRRPVKELILEVRLATAQLSQDLGRAPGESDLARYLNVTVADLREAQYAEIAAAPCSLDAPIGGAPDAATVADWLGADDPAVERMLGMQAVAAHWGELPAREQRVLLLSFYGDMTQVQIGAQLGVSQMQVSRLISHALSYLRPRILGLPESASGTAASATSTADPGGLPVTGRPPAQFGSATRMKSRVAGPSAGAGLAAAPEPPACAEFRSSVSRRRDGTSTPASKAPRPNSAADTVKATL
jgi:RNA polymerase sigma-B factor